MQTSSPPYYSTKDFNTAATLIASGLSLKGVERNGACYFRFADYNRAEAISEAFFRGDLTVNARAMVDAQRRLKDIIFGGSK